MSWPIKSLGLIPPHSWSRITYLILNSSQAENLTRNGEQKKLTSLKELTILFNEPNQVPCYKEGDWVRPVTGQAEISRYEFG